MERRSQRLRELCYTLIGDHFKKREFFILSDPADSPIRSEVALEHRRS